MKLPVKATQHIAYLIYLRGLNTGMHVNELKSYLTELNTQQFKRLLTALYDNRIARCDRRTNHLKLPRQWRQHSRPISTLQPPHEYVAEIEQALTDLKACL